MPRGEDGEWFDERPKPTRSLLCTCCGIVALITGLLVLLNAPGSSAARDLKIQRYNSAVKSWPSEGARQLLEEGFGVFMKVHDKSYFTAKSPSDIRGTLAESSPLTSIRLVQTPELALLQQLETEDQNDELAHLHAVPILRDAGETLDSPKIYDVAHSADYPRLYAFEQQVPVLIQDLRKPKDSSFYEIHGLQEEATGVFFCMPHEARNLERSLRK